jgi:hypothetical protein
LARELSEKGIERDPLAEFSPFFHLLVFLLQDFLASSGMEGRNRPGKRKAAFAFLSFPFDR